MRNLLLLSLSIWTIFPVFADKGFHFPDEDYTYAKIYYYNLGEIKTQPDTYIYNDQEGWAKSLVDPNLISSHGLAENMEKLFLYGADGLLTGLSGCFIPRHGLVYFDENDQPVASLSICLECEGIRMWTKSKGKIKPKSNGSVERAENQIGTLRTFLKKEGITVSDNPNDYDGIQKNTITSDFTDEEFNQRFDEKIAQKEKEIFGNVMLEKKPHGVISVEQEKLDKKIVNAYYLQVFSWNSKNSFKKETEIKYTLGGDKYEFAKLYMDDGTALMFDGVDSTSKMVEAQIFSPDVVLPNNIHVGSSVNDVLQTFYQDTKDNQFINAMELIIVEDENNTISYYLDEGIVDRIVIKCYGH